MSAFLVSTECMHDAVACVLITRFNNNRFGPFRISFDPDIGTPELVLHVSTVGRRIGRALYRLNNNALHFRYGPNSTERKVERTYLYPEDEVSRLLPEIRAACSGFGDPEMLTRIAKNAECLLYQCSEGPVPTHRLFVALTSCTKDLAHLALLATPTWKNAPWGSRAPQRAAAAAAA